MLSIVAFGTLGVVFIASIIFSGFAYRKQQALSLRKSQVRQLKTQITSLKDQLSTLLKVDKGYQLAQIVQDEICLQTQKMLNLTDADETIASQLQAEQELLSQLEKNRRTNEIRQAMDSDQELSLVNFQLIQTAKLVTKRKRQGKLPQGKYTELILMLQRITLDVDIASHSLQAERYLATNDRISAQAHLKQAREKLKSSRLEFAEKADLLKDLNDKIKNIQRNISITQEAPEVESPPDTTASQSAQKKRF